MRDTMTSKMGPLSAPRRWISSMIIRPTWMQPNKAKKHSKALIPLIQLSLVMEDFHGTWYRSSYFALVNAGRVHCMPAHCFVLLNLPASVQPCMQMLWGHVFETWTVAAQIAKHSNQKHSIAGLFHQLLWNLPSWRSLLTANYGWYHPTFLV